MISGMVQGYSISSLGEIFQELLCRLTIYSKFTELLNLLEYVEYFESFHLFLSISKY